MYKLNEMTKITEADKKFIAKFLGNLPIEGKKECIVRNRFSGTHVVVTPLVAVAIGLVYDIESAMSSGNEALSGIHPDLKMSNAVMNFDRARMLVLKLDSEAYYEILD